MQCSARRHVLFSLATSLLLALTTHSCSGGGSSGSHTDAGDVGVAEGVGDLDSGGEDSAMGEVAEDTTTPDGCATDCLRCGNGIIEAANGEVCDDGNEHSGDGCSDTCLVESPYVCGGEPSFCVGPDCGNGAIEPANQEQCDDANTDDTDGCAACQIVEGWDCLGAPSECTSICGDGLVVGDETCDDGGEEPGDSCSASCQREPGWYCDDSDTCVTSCGDGIAAGPEGCDDGNDGLGDGCDDSCVEEEGWSCTTEGTDPSTCRSICGDGIVVSAEACEGEGTLAGCNGGLSIPGPPPGVTTCASCQPALIDICCQTPEWAFETVASFGDVGLFPSLALDDRDNPIIAYLDATSGQLRLAERDRTGFASSPLGDADPLPISLALDHAGRPHIAYTRGGALIYRSFDGSIWLEETLDEEGEYVSLALDGDDHPYLSYLRPDSSDPDELVLQYTRDEGSGWHASLLEDPDLDPALTTTVEAAPTSIATDSSGRVYIGYVRRIWQFLGESPAYPFYAHLHEGFWVDGGVIDDVAWSGYFIRMAVDPADTPHASFGRSPRETRYFWYASREADHWSDDNLVAGTGIRVTASSSLRFDALGRAHVAYNHADETGFTYAFDNARPGWRREPVETAGEVEYLDLALDRSGRPHVAYYDASTTALRYGHWSCPAERTP